MRSHPTAGQATLEYIAAVALVAALLLVAAPAVGAPDIGRGVADAIRHGICLVGGDICTNGDARRAGLPPCPLSTRTSGWDGAVEVTFVDVGGKFTLAVTKKSDGSVSVVRVANAGHGVSGGFGAELDAGPIRFSIGGDGKVTKRFQVAAGWDFPDEKTASKFLEHSLRNAVRLKRWPPSWWSTERADEVVVVDRAGGRRDRVDDRYQVVGASAFVQVADGAVSRRGGGATFYARTTLDGPEWSAPLTPSKGRGRTEWIVELTRRRAGPPGRARVPQRLAQRHGQRAHGGRQAPRPARSRQLRRGASHCSAQAALAHRAGPREQALAERLPTHGTIETSVYRIDDDTNGASGALKAAVEVGLGAKKIDVMTDADRDRPVQRGALTGKRLDCVPGELVERAGMKSTMRAVVLDAPGPPEALQIRELPVPQAGGRVGVDRGQGLRAQPVGAADAARVRGRRRSRIRGCSGSRRRAWWRPAPAASSPQGSRSWR